MWNQKSNNCKDNCANNNQVQEENYQNFDKESSCNQFSLPLYTNSDQFYQQKEQAKPSQNMDQNIPQFIGIPIILNPNQQVSVLPIPLNNNNQQQQEVLEQSTAKTNTDEVLLKNLNFINKSQHALQSLVLLIIQQICLLFGTFSVFIILEHSSMDQSPYYLFLYFPLYVTFLFMSNFSYFRKFIFSLLLYFIHILLTSLVIFYFCTLFSKQRKEDGFSATDYANATLYCILIIPLNTIEIIFIMIYLCIESKKLQFIIILPLLCVIYGFLLVFQYQLYIILLPSLLYGILLVNAINQSFKGRFYLKKGQILSTTNSYNFGIIIPFQICF